MLLSSPARGFALQQRDRELLTELARYGCLTSAQIASLVFADASPQVARRRLLKLTRAGLLSRVTLPRGLVPLPTRLTGRPVYRLTAAGAAVVDAAVKPRMPTFGTTLHDLLANDVLLRLASAVGCTSLTPEPELRRRVLQARAQGSLPAGMIVPDGALHLPGGTVYLELVRTSVRRGNRGYGRKLAAYVRLSRAGAFRRVFGHERVRAMLTVTTSPSRATHLAAEAARLPRGSRMFWFGALGSEGALPTEWQRGRGAAETLSSLQTSLTASP